MATTEGSENRMRKNSTQLNSFSSSSELSDATIEPIPAQMRQVQRNYSVGSAIVSTPRVRLSDTTRVASVAVCGYTTTEPSAKSKDVEDTRSDSHKAPLISISAIIGDLEDAEGEIYLEETSSDCALISEPFTQQHSIEVEEDSTHRELPSLSTDLEPEASTSTVQLAQSSQLTLSPQQSQQPDNNVNEVCPWEDE